MRVLPAVVAFLLFAPTAGAAALRTRGTASSS